jgi:hypothetical protein
MVRDHSREVRIRHDDLARKVDQERIKVGTPVTSALCQIVLPTGYPWPVDELNQNYYLQAVTISGSQVIGTSLTTGKVGPIFVGKNLGNGTPPNPNVYPLPILVITTIIDSNHFFVYNDH